MKRFEAEIFNFISFTNYQKVKDITTFYPKITDGPKPIALDVHDNLERLLNEFLITVRYNIMTRSREVHIPSINYQLDVEQNLQLTFIENLAIQNKMKSSRVDKHLNIIADASKYHPIVDCIKSKKWDKIPRLDRFIQCLKISEKTDTALAYKIVKTWMVSAIATIFTNEVFSCHGVLVLQGKQYIGKTKWIKMLDPANCNAVKAGALLDPSNKDSVIACSKYWIVELGELDATFRKADIARLKSFITNEIDNVRAPYDPKESSFVRRTAYAASVNDDKFLVDMTGNRRWWTIALEDIDFSEKFDMQQVWAEVLDAWQQGHPTYFSNEDQELINISNEKHQQIDPFEEKLLEAFDWSEGWQDRVKIEMTVTQVLEKIGYPRPSQRDTNRMSAFITKKTGTKSKRTSRGNIHFLPNFHADFVMPKEF